MAKSGTSRQKSLQIGVYFARPIEDEEEFIQRQRDAEDHARRQGTEESLAEARRRAHTVNAYMSKRHMDRPKTARDPVMAIGSHRLRLAAERLRDAYEGFETGMYEASHKAPKDPPADPLEALPPIKNPPSPPDPINRWHKAKRVWKTNKDGELVKMEAPPTFPPKRPKRGKFSGNDRMAELVSKLAIRERKHREAVELWLSAVEPFETALMRCIVRDVIVFRMPYREAALKAGYKSGGGRNNQAMRTQVEIAMKAAADYLGV
ncbi:hypothetical protein [Henriciella aquimarina]|uniref:hypothetical protein n=1 Tax=Henriciella aquimarina TaxID=545261 RepID=UPI0009FEABD9|nr:hypothetical protein [Henriciella aquimarina]